jgi:hypothetical protein
VGYKIRFQDRTSPDAYIKVVTDGILLAETQGDPWLNEYDTIIVDEAHERSLNIDFVLGILKRLVHRRKNLKLIITSATIDTEKFSKAFDDAPVIEVSGRLFPVETRYFFPDAAPEEKEDRTPVELAAQAVDRLVKKQPRGDILIFMPTEQDIRETCETLGGRNYPRTVILPLFARLSAGSSAGFSPPPRPARSSWPPTWPRRPSPSPASATWWTRAWRASPSTCPGPGPPPCRWCPSPEAAPTSARAAAGGWKTGSASVFTPRRTTSTGPCSPSRKSCVPTWPRSSCA